MGQRLARNISDAVAQLDAVSDDDSASVNEVHKLKDRINALPLDLLKSQDIVDRSEEHYHETAILCISLKHLPAYLETLDESRLQSYVATLHRMTFGSAGFYGGDLRVARQFGLAVYFSRTHAAALLCYAPPAVPGCYRAAASWLKSMTDCDFYPG